jgi:hypothetical protein
LPRWRPPDTVGGIDTDVVVPDTDPTPGRGIRLFVGGFLGLFLIGGLLGLEAWPVTGWKMYARLRHGDFWGWQVRAIGVDGSERSVDLRNAPAAYHGVTHFLSDFERLSAEDRQAVCLALAQVARTQSEDVAGVAIDHVLGRIPVDPGGPSGPSERVRIHRC